MKSSLKIFFLLILFSFLNSCVTGARLRTELDAEKQRIENDEKRGAKLCVSYDLAMAKSHLVFAELELDDGNYVEASEHLALLRAHAANTTKNADICIPKDTDGDGVLDKYDRCPKVPGPKSGKGCPDGDGDGVIDKFDKCPDQPGVPELKGCPDVKVGDDSDKDGIKDAADQCPYDPEDKDNYKDFDGCPDKDNDQDGILDKDDRCPDNAGPATNQGCPIKDKDKDGIPDEIDKCIDVKAAKTRFIIIWNKKSYRSCLFAIPCLIFRFVLPVWSILSIMYS